jgi:hypothetical protein
MPEIASPNSNTTRDGTRLREQAESSISIAQSDSESRDPGNRSENSLPHGAAVT